MNYKLIALAIIMTLCFGAGWKAHSWKTDAATLAQIQQAEEKADKFKAKSDEIETAYIQVANELTKKQTEVIRYVPKIITVKDDAACTINRGAIRLYNNSVQGQTTSPELTDGTPAGIELSSFASYTADNNFICRKEIEKLKGLQQVVREYLKMQDE